MKRKQKWAWNLWRNSKTELLKTENKNRWIFSHTELKKRVGERVSNELKETATGLRKHPSRGKRVSGKHRLKMTGLNKGCWNSIRQSETAIQPKTERAVTPWAIFSAIYLTQKNVLGISAGTPEWSISLILRQTWVIKKKLWIYPEAKLGSIF